MILIDLSFCFSSQLGITAASLKFDRNANRREASIRESVSSHQLVDFGWEPTADPPAEPTPVPPPRSAKKNNAVPPPTAAAAAAPLITLENNNVGGAEQTPQNMEFDPLKLSSSNTSSSNISGNTSGSSLLNQSNSSSQNSVNYTSPSSASSQESLGGAGVGGAPKRVASVNRKPAFKGVSRPSGVQSMQRPASSTSRTSPTLQHATDASSIKDARTAFIKTEHVKPATILPDPAGINDKSSLSSSSSGLDQFDPLLTGQLVMDSPKKAGSTKPQEDDLLKAWDLDFSRQMKSPSISSPPVPPKPFQGGQGGHPLQGYSQRPPMQPHRPVSNSPFLLHEQQLRTSGVGSNNFLQQQPPQQYRPPSPSHIAYRPASPNTRPNKPQTADPFADLLGDLGSGQSKPTTTPSLLQQQQSVLPAPAPVSPPTRPVSMVTLPSQAQKNWETFD